MFVVFISGAFITTRITFSAAGIIPTNKSIVKFLKSAATPEPENTPPSNILPQQIPVLRIKIMIGETRDVPVMDAANLMIVSPEIASAQIKTASVMTISGLKIGETILIISGNEKRQTFIIEVGWKPPVPERQNSTHAENTTGENAKTSGSVNVLYANGFEQSPSLLRNRLELRRKFSKERTLRVSGEMYKFFGGSYPPGLVSFRNYGLDRISVGIDSPGQTIDFLDSQVRTSHITSNSFEIRGFHLVSTPKLSKNSELSRKGIEIFAGFGRPVNALSNKDRAKIVGSQIPVASSDSWQLRAGFITITTPKNNQSGRGGTVLQLTGSYAPNKIFSADGEIGFAHGALSWGARLNVKLRKFGAFGEIAHTDKNSPLGSLGAFSGGRQSESFAVNWRPDNRLSFSVNYNYTSITRFKNSSFANFKRSTFSANASYRQSNNSRFSFHFLDQQTEAAVPGSSLKFQIVTRTFNAGHNILFNKHISNDFEARINFSSEANAGSELENGFNLSERLRFSWGRNSVTGFFNYTNRTPSIASLIISNPQLLPPVLQAAFVLDPIQFLQLNRDRLAFLLPSLELPFTRNMDAGIRFQTVVSRFTLSGEMRYGTNEIFSQNQKNIFTSIGVDLRLDAANSVQINGGYSFGKAGGGSAMTFGFTHRLGSDSVGGFQFSKLLGLDKGKVSGRVYYDLNSNGQDDHGEPGVPDLIVQLNEKRGVKTNSDGRYEFSANEGRYTIALISEDLGVRLRASTATEQQIFLSARKTINVSFGVSGYGFISGRIFNDAVLTSELTRSNIREAAGVRVVLHSLEQSTENIVVDQMSSNTGTYEFRNLRPGKYRLEIDSATLPANFRLPDQNNFREITVTPLQGSYLDIPIAAGRAISGIVFIDKDGNGKFNPEVEETVAGANITANDTAAVSDRNGAYIIRDLPAGKIKITFNSPLGTTHISTYIELGAEPVTIRGFNFAMKR